MAPIPACWLFKTSAINKLTFDLLTLKVVSESRVMWATSVPILVFLGLSVLELGPMYTTVRQTDIRRQTNVRQKHSLMPPPYIWGRRHNNNTRMHCALTCLFLRSDWADSWSPVRLVSPLSLSRPASSNKKHPDKINTVSIQYTIVGGVA